MKENDRDAVVCLATLANLPMTEARIASLARSLSSVQAAVLSLRAVEYSGVEPACRFRSPPGPQQ